jgi:hypothetical protein
MRRKSLTVDLPLTPSFFRQFCAAPAVLPTIVCPFLVETDVFVRIAGLFVTLLSTGAAIACVITQYFLSWRGAILHLGLIQVCAAGTCENSTLTHVWSSVLRDLFPGSVSAGPLHSCDLVGLCVNSPVSKRRAQ